MVPRRQPEPHSPLVQYGRVRQPSESGRAPRSEAVRPYIPSHGGEVEILEVTDGEVHLRLRGSCESCAASAATLQHGVKAALQEDYPGFRRLVGHEPEPVEQEGSQSDLVQLSALVFRDLLALSELADHSVVVAESEEKRILLVRIGDDVYAFDSCCPACGASLGGASLSGFVLVCPLGNCAYDARNGRRRRASAPDPKFGRRPQSLAIGGAWATTPLATCGYATIFL